MNDLNNPANSSNINNPLSPLSPLNPANPANQINPASPYYNPPPPQEESIAAPKTVIEVQPVSATIPLDQGFNFTSFMAVGSLTLLFTFLILMAVVSFSKDLDNS